LLSSQYSYDGIARFSFFWDNPNHAAAVIACFMPLLWGFQRSTSCKSSSRFTLYGVYIAEVVGVVCLVLTFSRGGGVAWIVGLFFFAGVEIRLIGMSKAAALRATLFCMSRLLLFTGLSYLCGLAARFGEKNDASILNRLDLWKGGLQLIDASPIVGWGKGNSGLAYMQWLQRPDATAGYGGMVNTYLHMTVEFGIPFLMLYCFLLVAPAFYCVLANRATESSETHMQHAYATSLVAFSVASLFSTLWLILGVVWLPVSIILAIFLGAKYRKERSATVKAALIALFVVLASGLGLYSLACYTNTHSEWRLRLMNDGALNFRRNQPDNSGKVIFVPDMHVLGAYFGKEIRRSISETKQAPSEFTIYPPATEPSINQDSPAIIMGKRIQTMKQIAPASPITLLFPLGPPIKSEKINPEFLMLPAYANIGHISHANAWRVWAREKNIPVWTIPWSGQDARAHLSEIIEISMGHYKQSLKQ